MEREDFKKSIKPFIDGNLINDNSKWESDELNKKFE
jgi:hypothetical protein